MDQRWITALAFGLAAGGCGERDEAPTEAEYRELPLLAPFEPATVPAPDAAVCSIKVRNHGTKAMETEYLPNVLACEAPGAASLPMLEAQAIAARSYASYHAIANGEICNGQGCQVYSCGKTPTALHRQAVANTSGLVLRYNDNLTIGFYVAGDKTPNADCSGNSTGVGNTEKWVTYNEGRTDADIVQTKIAWRHVPSDDDWGQNRGALSQWGAHCLASQHDYDAMAILRYYYGADIELQQTQGTCVADHDFDGDAAAGCGTLDAEVPTIIDNGAACLNLQGPSKYWRTESAGEGGSLRWTKSTATVEHNVAVWSLNPEQDGDYRLAVHIDEDFTTGTHAQYEVVDALASRTIEVDQTQGGWIDLGVFTLHADAADQQVRMSDAVGIAGEILQVDALRITPAAFQEGCDGGDCPADAVTAPPAVSGARGGDAALGCRIGGGSGGYAGLLVLLGLWRRRRRQGSSLA